MSTSQGTQTPHPEARDIIRPHAYDGIEEYENPLPGWWTWVFYATIAWSVFYVVAIGLGYITNYEEDWQAENAEVLETARAYAATHPQVELGEAELAAVVTSAERITAGGVIFGEKCASCHGPDGGGLIGPNLTDANWIHGGALASIHKVINEGVLEKGMPGWSGTLKPEEVLAALSYVHSLQGTTPATPKEPQGDLYVPAEGK